MWIEKLRSSHESVSVARQIVINVWGVGIIALLIVSALELIDYLLYQYYFAISSLFPPWFVNTNSFFVQALRIEKDIVKDYLSTIASIGGVFLGLYFAAISVVAGSLFSSVSGTIRHQLVREKAGNFYVKVLALLINAAILLLGYQSVGRTISILNIVFMMVLSLFGVLSFVLLGRRVFDFFDLSKLADPVYGDIYRNIRLASVDGYAWDNVGFQSYYQKEASKHLNSISIFVRTTLGLRSKEENPLVRILIGLSRLLSHYQKQKRKIPTKSNWYELTPTYQNWFLSDTTSLTVALKANVGLQPKFKPNTSWFETEACEIIQMTLGEVMNEKEVRIAYRILEPFSETLRVYGEELALQESEVLLAIIRNRVAQLVGTFKGVSPCNIEANIHFQGLVDIHGYCVLGFIMGLLSTANSFEQETIEHEIAGIDWEKEKSLYRSKFPSSMLERIEFVGQTGLFERRVEGEHISPVWYRKQLVVMQYLKLLSDGLRKAVELLTIEFLQVAKDYLAEDRPYFAAMHAYRGLEACEKLHRNSPQIKENVSTFEKFRILKDLPWSSVGWEELDRQLKNNRQQLTAMLARCLSGLSKTETRKDTPDLFGQSYNTVYAQTIFCLQRNDATEFVFLFPYFFDAAIRAFDRLKKEEELRDETTENKLVFGTEPIVDLMDLSGYARIYSELHQNPGIWATCEKKWDEYLSGLSDVGGTLSFYVTTFYYRESLGKLIPRDVLRSNWEIDLNSELRKRKLIDDHRYPHHGIDDEVLGHPSAFIRAFCFGKYEPHYSAVDMFFLTYLKQRSEAALIRFEDKYDFLDQLERELKKEESNSKSKEAQ